ncbi:papain-like cysteine protease family protein [Candidatus Entotheonella palauensis]|uniref:papain-like cysteine protease family protein n=1 Tax=Candidatus Entotheonella palauensis TaxID=93172 RepID=UPI000B7D8D15|nr:papain-like cysteine protease family protein [Candidatus Entotheonella palauensis]
MKVYKGQLIGSSSGYQFHIIEIAFEARQLESKPKASASTVPFSVRAIASDAGDFIFEIPDDMVQVTPIRIAVYDPSGGLLTEGTVAALPVPSIPLQIQVQPGVPFELEPHPDPFSDAPALFSGRLIERDGRRTLNGRQIILYAKRKFADADSDPIETVLEITRSTPNGYFSMPYPKLFLVEARVDVSDNIDSSQTTITLDDEGRLPPEVQLLVTIPEDDTSGDTSEVDADTETPRAPGPEDLTNAPEVYTSDLGGGRCVELNKPNRTLEAYQYFKIVRTTDPFILGRKPKAPPRIPPPVMKLASKLALGYQSFDATLQLRSDVPDATRPPSTSYQESGLAVSASWRGYLDPDSTTKTIEQHALQLSPQVLASILRDPDGFTPMDLMAAERLSGFEYLNDLITSQGQSVSSRQEVTVNTPVDWEELPKFSQATTIAHGHILQFHQVWKANGYSMGDLLYSLPLAPCQKKEIVIVDWDRRESAIRSESRRFDERLDARLAHDRGISEVVKSVLTESIQGGSNSNVWGAGGGFGLGIPIGSGFLGIGAGGGAGGASADAWQNGSRTLTASSLQQLRERITQSASALRSQRATVVQSVRQGETHQVETEVVANHNHCHAITIEYFEVLQHFRIHQELVSVRECLFIPLIMSAFDDSKALRWRDALERHLLKPGLADGFDAIERIRVGYDGTDYPMGTYATQVMEAVSGELKLRLTIARPRDPQDDELPELYFSEVWGFFSSLFPSAAKDLYNTHLKNQENKDRIFQAELAPRIARAFVESMTVRFKRSDDSWRNANLDVTMVADYREGRSHLVRLNPANNTPKLPRNQIKGIEIRVASELPPGSKVIVEFASFQYTTDFHSETLYRSRRVRNDLKQNDPALFNTTRLTPLEQRNPRQEDLTKRRQLLKHLNENLEFYHRILWWRMDANRRFMLLDGFEAPFSDGRSVASVVENQLVAIVGNCLVMPVAPGFQLDPRYREASKPAAHNQPRPTLMDLYTPLTPPKPFSLSLPTKGVFAEAVIGACNSCEEIDDTRFWRWEQEPCPDEPTPIAPVTTESRRTSPPDLTPKDFPTPIVNIQNAPAAPAPTDLGAALQVLGNADAFRDITGLEQTQLNALAALQSSLKTAESFGKQAAGFVKAQGARRGLQRSLGAIDTALKKKLINKADAQELTAKAFNTALGTSSSAGKKPVEKQAVKDLMSLANQAPKSKVSVQDQEGDRIQTVTIEKDNTEQDLDPAIDFQVPGRLRMLQQPNDMACWATVATILLSWKFDRDYEIEDVLTIAGQEFLDIFNAEQGLKSTDKLVFLARLGLKVASRMDIRHVEAYEQLLRTPSPLWITADEDPSANFSVHARVLIGMRSGGTPENTEAILIDTATGTRACESFAVLMQKIEELAIGDDAFSGSFRPQIVHF